MTSADLRWPPPGAAAQPSGQRHAWLDAMCGHLAAAVYARHASELLAGPLPGSAALVELPVWQWAPAGPKTGKKGRASDGGRLLLPVRIDWDGPTVRLVKPKTELDLAWTTRNPDYHLDGRTRVTVGGRQAHTGDGPEPPAVLTAPAQPRSALRAELSRIVRAGQTARWRAWTQLEPWVRRAVETGHERVAYELGGRQPGAAPVLDSSDLDTVHNRMMLGDDQVSGTVPRLWNRMLDPSCFDRADPMAYIRINLARDAPREVSRMLGDPKCGPKVRAFAHGRHFASIDELVSAYRSAHGGESLGVRAAAAAIATPGLVSGYRRRPTDPERASGRSPDE